MTSEGGTKDAREVLGSPAARPWSDAASSEASLGRSAAEPGLPPAGRLPMFCLTFFQTVQLLLANFLQFLRGPFSALSTPNVRKTFKLEKEFGS